MADNPNQDSDIRVLVGVAGGTSIDEGSGAKIRKELQQIASTLSAQKAVKISVFLNDGMKTRLQKQLNELAKDLKLTVDVDIGNVGGSGGGTGGGTKKRGSGGARNTDYTAKNAARSIQQLQQAEKIYNRLAGKDQTIQFVYEGKTKGLSDIDDLMLDIMQKSKDLESQTSKMTDQQSLDFQQLKKHLDDYVKAYNNALKQKTITANNQSLVASDRSAVDAISKSLSRASSVEINGTTVYLKQVEDAQQKALQAIEAVENSSSKATKQQLREVETRRKAYENLVAEYNRAQGIGTAPKSNLDYVDKMSKRIATVRASLVSVSDTFANQSDGIKYLDDLDAKFKLIEDDIVNEASGYRQVAQAFKISIDQRIKDVQKFAEEVKKANSEQAKALTANERYRADKLQQVSPYKQLFDDNAGTEQAEKYRAAYAALEQTLDRIAQQSDKATAKQKRDISQQISNIQKLHSELKKVLAAEETAQQKQPDIASQSKAMQSSLNQYLMTVSPAALTKFAAQIETINRLLEDKTPESMKAATNAIRDLKTAIKDAGYEGGNFFTYLSGKIKTFATYLMSTYVTNAVIGSVRNMKDNVVTLDGAITDLMIVTGKTRNETEQLMKTYNQMARQLGTTTANVASGSLDWLRQGYNEADTANLLRQSMTLSVVGNMDATEATTALTAALKGYRLEVENASDVVDKFFAVDMKAATSASNLAAALAKTAANAKLAGISLDTVVGQLAVTNEIMQESGEETGGTMRLVA